MTRIILLTLFFLVILNSCSIQKRTYNRGFAINWHINKGNSIDRLKPKHPNYSKQNGETKRNTIENQEIKPEDTLFLSIHKGGEIKNKSADSTMCDLIILISGEEVFGKVTHVEHDVIKYKKCDNLDGPAYSIDKSTVFIIKYSNGTRDLINVIEDKIEDNVNPPSTSNVVEGNKRGDFYGGVSSAFAMFSVLLLFIEIAIPLIIFSLIVAFAFGVIGMYESNNSLAVFGTFFSLLMGLLLLYLFD